MLLLALVFYLKYEAPEEEQNFAMVMDIIRYGTIDSEEDEGTPSPLDKLFIEKITGGSMAQTLATTVSIPEEVTVAVANLGFFANIGTWLVAMLGSLFVTVLSSVMLITVYGSFFKIYIYAALAPIPLAAFAGEPTQSVGVSYIKSFCGVLLEGAVIALACIIFSAYAAGNITGDVSETSAFGIVWGYLLELIINLLVLVSTIKIADRIIKEMLGI